MNDEEPLIHQPSDMDDFVKTTLELIEKSGHSITCVIEPPVPFAYTVGLGTRTDHAYEMAVSCGDPETIGILLNSTPAFLVDNEIQPSDGAVLEGVIGNGYRLGLRRVLDLERFKAVRAIYGECPPVYQVLWPDIDNKLPGEDGYDEQACPQVLL